jgi:hypothetical protein
MELTLAIANMLHVRNASEKCENLSLLHCIVSETNDIMLKWTFNELKKTNININTGIEWKSAFKFSILFCWYKIPFLGFYHFILFFKLNSNYTSETNELVLFQMCTQLCNSFDSVA